MNVRRVVVDTSALLDAIDASHPEWSEAFAYLQGAYPFQAPRLIGSEAGNVVHAKHPDVFGSAVGERVRVLEDLLEGVEPVDPTPEARERCGEIVAETGLTYYDAEFLELAERTGDGLLLTQDAELLSAARELVGRRRAVDLEAAGEGIADGEL